MRQATPWEAIGISRATWYRHGKPTEIGFGSARDVPLADARELAAQARKKLAAGENPKQVRRSTTEASFGACAERLIAAMRPSWRNAEHARQWETTLRRDAAALCCCPLIPGQVLWG